jgi:hypothetical protein
MNRLHPRGICFQRSTIDLSEPFELEEHEIRAVFTRDDRPEMRAIAVKRRRPGRPAIPGRVLKPAHVAAGAVEQTHLIREVDGDPGQVGRDGVESIRDRNLAFPKGFQKRVGHTEERVVAALQTETAVAQVVGETPRSVPH